MLVSDTVAQVVSGSLLTPITFPNALPANYRRSKAWRSHYLGYWKEGVLKRNIFLIFVFDDKYGFCKYAMLRGRDAVSQRRKGKSYLRFQCGYEKHRVVIFCLDESYLHEEADIFDEMHRGLIAQHELNIGNIPQDFAVQCDDSFEGTENAA